MYGHHRRRHKMSRHHSAHHFSRVAQWIHPVNVHRDPMRGGFRL